MINHGTRCDFLKSEKIFDTSRTWRVVSRQIKKCPSGSKSDERWNTDMRAVRNEISSENRQRLKHLFHTWLPYINPTFFGCPRCRGGRVCWTRARVLRCPHPITVQGSVSRKEVYLFPALISILSEIKWPRGFLSPIITKNKYKPSQKITWFVIIHLIALQLKWSIANTSLALVATWCWCYLARLSLINVTATWQGIAAPLMECVVDVFSYYNSHDRFNVAELFAQHISGNQCVYQVSQKYMYNVLV